MQKRMSFALLLVAVASVLILSACSTPTPAEPTVDPNMIYTQAVQTVQAGLTKTAEALPPPTETPAPTETPEPTATEMPTQAPAVQPQPGPTTDPAAQPAVPANPANPAVPAIPTLAPIVQPTKAGARPVATTAALGQSGDHAAFGSQSPADNSHFDGLQQVTVFWSLVNTGTTTWTKGNYRLTWVGGTAMSGTTSVALEKDVKPGEKGEFYTLLITPDVDGKYRSTWRLFNGGGQPVPGGEVYLTYIVP